MRECGGAPARGGEGREGGARSREESRGTRDKADGALDGSSAEASGAEN